ncbi:unnamed protein product [Rhodiola kirilowii]
MCIHLIIIPDKPNGVLKRLTSTDKLCSSEPPLIHGRSRTHGRALLFRASTQPMEF